MGVAVQHALETNSRSIACVSTGNVGNALASFAASSGLRAAVLYPRSVDESKRLFTAQLGARILLLDGTYDQANALARALDDACGVPFVNVSLRPYYAEGAKTLVFEVLEQLRWRPPEHIIVPVAGTTLLRKVVKGLREAVRLAY